MSGKTTDDFEAVRIVVETLGAFKGEDRERILRWAREKLGMTGAVQSQPPPAAAVPALAPPSAVGSVSGAAAAAPSDIRSFVGQKSPRTDIHFAATVAYYHQFVAPELARKGSIGKEDLVDACRKVDRKRPASSAQVLVNAYQDGLLDRAEKGQYKLNSVGENLVAMVLPVAADGKRSTGPRKRRPRNAPARRRATKR